MKAYNTIFNLSETLDCSFWAGLVGSHVGNTLDMILVFDKYKLCHVFVYTLQLGEGRKRGKTIYGLIGPRFGLQGD